MSKCDLSSFQRTTKPVRSRVGDIVAIPLPNQRFAFGRILKKHGLLVFDFISHTIAPDVDWHELPKCFYASFHNISVRSGEWPIVAHVRAVNPDDNWKPPTCIRDLCPPHKVRYILDRTEIRAATEEDAVGLEEFCMLYPIGVVMRIEERLLGLPPRQFVESKPMKSLSESAFSNDDAFEVTNLLQRARGWSSLHKCLNKAAKPKGYLEAPPAKMAVAAAEVIAAAWGQPLADLPEVVPPFLNRVSPPDAELLELARKAVDRILRDSELRDLWEESKHFADWRVAMTDLQARLARCQAPQSKKLTAQRRV